MRCAMLTAILLLGCGERSDEPDAAPTGVTIRATWELTSRGAASTCGAEGATTVRVSATNASSVTTTTDFPCVAFTGETAPLAPGVYQIAIELRDATTVLGGPALYADQQLLVPGTSHQVAPVTFDFSRYSVVFAVDFGTATTCDTDPANCNCDATGSAVARQRIFLHHTGESTCQRYVVDVPVTSEIGTDPTGCFENALCVENTSTQTILLVPAGSFTIDVEGEKETVPSSPVTCYYGSTAFTISWGQSTDPDLGTIQVPFAPLLADVTACNATKR